MHSFDLCLPHANACFLELFGSAVTVKFIQLRTVNDAPVPFSFQPWLLRPVELHTKPLVPPPPDYGLIDNAVIGHIQEESIRYRRIGSHAQLGAAFVLIPDRARYFRTSRQDDRLLQHIRAAKKAAFRLGFFFFHCLVPPRSALCRMCRELTLHGSVCKDRPKPEADFGQTHFAEPLFRRICLARRPERISRKLADRRRKRLEINGGASHWLSLYG
jgi:hypothetical protein